MNRFRLEIDDASPGARVIRMRAIGDAPVVYVDARRFIRSGMYGYRLIPGGGPVSRPLVQVAVPDGTQTFLDQQIINEQAEQPIDRAGFLHRAERNMAVIERQRRFLLPMLVKPRQQTAAHHVAVLDAYPLLLFQRMITVSLETMKIVRALPELDILPAETAGGDGAQDSVAASRYLPPS